MDKLHVPTLALFLALTAQAWGAADESKVKITDPKLHSINYALDSLEHWISKAIDGDKQRTAALLRDHQKIVLRFARIPKAESDQYRYVLNRIVSLKHEIENKADPGTVAGVSSSGTKAPDQKSTRPHPALPGIQSQLNALLQDVSRYRDNDKQRSRMRSDLGTLSARYARVPKSQHPDYLNVGEKLAQVEQALQPAAGPLQMTDKEVADFVERIRVRYSEQLKLPRARDIMRSRELTAADVDSVIKKIEAFKTHASQDLPKLRQVVEATGNGRYWLEWIATKAVENLGRDLDAMEQMIEREVNFGLSTAKNRSELDVEKNNYAFNNEAMREQNEQLFARTARTLKQAKRFADALNRTYDWASKQKELEQCVALYRTKVQAAASVLELPEEAGNKTLHKIAVEVFKNKKYGVGKVVKRIVNSKPVPRDRIEHKEFAGKIETIVRQWEQFQVTTVEEENGKYFVYINDIAKFSRAPNPTPIDRWILKQRFKSGEIAKDRI